jgi:ParB family transcriptional regulator, chromosome partitioning protein
MIFDTEIAGNVKAAMTAAGARSGDLWMIDPRNLKVAEGFNVRDHDEAYEARVAWLTNEIQQKGFMRTAPLAGYAVRVGDENVVYITAGHRRLEATLRAIASGTPIERIPVITHPSGTKPADLVAMLHTENNSDPLKPNEIAKLCERLQAYGLDNDEIAKRLGFTPQYIKQLFDLAATPDPVRKMVAEGKVSASLAVKTVKAQGKKAQEVLETALADATADGKTKVTAKRIPKAPAEDPREVLLHAMAGLLKRVCKGEEGRSILARYDAMFAKAK